MGQPLLIFAPYLQCPFGVQKDLHGERAKRASLRMGWMDGWDGMGWDGTEYQKCPSNFFILCEYIVNLNTYIYPCSKFVTNFVMGLKI